MSVNGTLAVPDPWKGTPVSLPGATLVMTWRYGATLETAAALASLACALVLTGVLVLTRRQSQREQPDAAIELS